MKFTNNLLVFNGDEWHTEVCKSMICESINECNGTESYLRSDYNSEIPNDHPMCFDCMAKDEIYQKMKCEMCNEIVYDIEQTDINLSDCQCNKKKTKTIKEKPILECQWVRVRDYQ